MPHRAPHEEEQPCGALAWQQGDTLDAVTQQALCPPRGSEGGRGHPQPLHAVCAGVTGCSICSTPSARCVGLAVLSCLQTAQVKHGLQV